jgi:hypothetical protein
LLITLLAGCAQPTPYQPAQGGYGFFEQWLEANRYRISFSGNSLTPQQVADDYMLFRAAEITLQNGFDYFEVADKQTDKSTRYLVTYDDFGRTYYSRRFPYDRFDTGFYTGNYRPIEQYTVNANIVLHRGRKPADLIKASDARDVIQRLGPSIRRPALAAP